MKKTDLRIIDVKLTLSEIAFRTPLKLSSGEISLITYAKAQVVAEDAAGRRGAGQGAVLLSDLWAFSQSSLSHDVRDKAMRLLTEKIGLEAKATAEAGDPFEIGRRLEARLGDLAERVRAELGLAEPIPRLAWLVCFSPWDAAIHDAWGVIAGRDTYSIYTSEFLNRDLGAYLGPAFAGKYPADYLRPPRTSIAVQHVVGGNDPLRPEDVPAGFPRDGIPNSLEDWMAQDGVYWLKLKVTGRDLEWDLRRIVDVYRLAAEFAERTGRGRRPMLSIDPNEACPTPDYIVELLKSLKERDSEAYASLQYVEQPTPRDVSSYTFTLHETAALKPVVMDESLDRLEYLDLVDRQGWSGIAVKTCKGQTHVMLAYCWAREHGRFVTIQDLTNPGLALVHSAQLARRLDLSAECIEFNSRQYIPLGCVEERAGHETLFQVRDGVLYYGGKGAGLY